MAGYLKALTTAARSAAAVVSQNPAALSPAAACHRRLEQRNCKSAVDQKFSFRTYYSSLVSVLVFFHNIHTTSRGGRSVVRIRSKRLLIVEAGRKSMWLIGELPNFTRFKKTGNPLMKRLYFSIQVRIYSICKHFEEEIQVQKGA